MKKTIVAIFVLLSLFTPIKAQNFNDYFADKACRVDFQLCGNKDITNAYLSKIKEEPHWGGRRARLDDNLNLGQYRFQVLDSASNRLLYSDDFSSLYFEWQTTAEAEKLTKCFEQTLQFPYPLKTVVVKIERRLGFQDWETLLSINLNPHDKLIEKTQLNNVLVREIYKTKSTDKAVDIAIIAEGYTEAEQDKFFADAKRIADQLLSHQPFTKHGDKININAVGAVSEESGISMPQNIEWKNTALGAHFYTFYEPRYLTTPNIYKLHDLAAHVAYDAIIILANTTNYGGGGIYNFYAVASADSKKAQREVLVHEFGHSFAGLGDEYFKEIPDVLDDMYDLAKEPWEPNITTLVNFDMKWKNDLPTDTEIPTPINEQSKKQTIGVFEGAGYMTKGMYRPAYNCRMRTNEAESFCTVCEKSIERMILHLTED